MQLRASRSDYRLREQQNDDSRGYGFRYLVACATAVAQSGLPDDVEGEAPTAEEIEDIRRTWDELVGEDNGSVPSLNCASEVR